MISHARRRRAGTGPGGFAVLDAESFELKGRWEDGGETPSLNYDFWYQPRQERDGLSASAASRTPTAGVQARRRQGGQYGHPLHFWDLVEPEVEQTIDLGEKGLIPLEVRFHHDPESTTGFVGAALSSTMWHSARQGRAGQPTRSSTRRPRRAQGLALPGPRPHQRPRPLDGRPLALLLQLAARRHPPVRRQRPGEPEADRHSSGSAACSGSQLRCGRELTGGPQMLQLTPRRPAPLRHQLALLELGQPVLPGAALLAPARELRPERRHGGRPRLLRRLLGPAGRSRACP